MNLVLVTPPTLEPVTLVELIIHLRGASSGTFAESIATSQSILPGAHAIHELMTLDVSPGGAGWAAGETITGATSHETCIIVSVLTTKTYYVRSRSGAFTLGEVLSNGAATADQGAANPTFATGYYLIGAGVDVLGKTSVVNLNAGTVGSSGTVEAKIQESDDNATYTDWTGGAFTLVNAANDNAIQEKAYTGAKQYIRVVSRVLVAACEFGADIIVAAPTTAEDSLLEEHITTARVAVESDSGRALINQTFDYFLNAWPSYCRQGPDQSRPDRIRLPRGNLVSVTSVSWKDTAGTETTLTAGTDYIVEDKTTNGDQYGFIVLPDGKSWPSVMLYPSAPIKIRFVCGYGATAASVPIPAKSAMKLYCGALYGERGEDVIGQINADSVTAKRYWSIIENQLGRLYWEF